jgi:predicted esterase
MEIKTNYIEVKKTARYATFGELSDKTKYFWFVLHGSKMRCEQMIYKFKDFDPDTHFVVAPEGLNRQYENGFGGDVVSSWMTKRDRIKEISDFSEYLSLIYTYFLNKLPTQTSKTILGFSQGGTTAFRWLNQHKVFAHHFIAYSCWIPEDIDLTLSSTNLDDLQLYYTYGIQDKFLTPKLISEITEVASRNNLKLNINPYPGTHKIERVQLSKLFESYIKK